MQSALYFLTPLACPIAMGLMMFLMMRGQSQGQANQAQAADSSEVEALRAEIEAIKAERAGTLSRRHKHGGDRFVAVEGSL
jgi:hypothetical protein